MAGILDHQGIFYQQGILSTQQFRDNLLGRNLPPPVNETLTQSGLVSKLDDIGKVINVPIFGTGDENIPVHYNEDERMFGLGTFFRTTQNVNLNPYSPQDDNYVTYELTIPPTLPKPQPEEFGEKEKNPYPISYSSERYDLINKGDKKGVAFPFNVIDKYKSLNFQRESSLGLVGGQQLEKTIIDKISQVETDQTVSITEPVGNVKDNYVDTLRGNNQFFNTLPNDAIGWNEYNSSNKVNGGSTDEGEGVEPTMSTEIRMKTLLSRTGIDQVQFAFNLLNRNPYRPLYEDRRLQGTEDEGTNGRYYIGTEKNTNRGALVTKTFDSSDFNGEIDTTGNGKRTTVEGIGEPFGEPNKFFWSTGGEQNFNEKTLLYKTQQLVNNSENEVFINQTKKFFKDKKQNRLISRGNAISELALIDAESNGNFCRVWTVNDRYSYFNAIRNTGLFTSENGTKGFSATDDKAKKSVLMDNGIPKYHPVKEDSKTTRKKFMFSLENLAWADNLADLPLWEIGPGDPVSGTKGRIMWFPPYDLKFDENTSANWTSTEFIGRSEPVYTYNNSKRSGSLSFRIIVDHPRVINCYRGQSNNLIERFFAGCVTPDDFLRALECEQSQTNFAEIEKKLNETKIKEVVATEKKSEDGVVKVDTKCVEVDPEACAEVSNLNSSDITSIANQIKSFIEEQNNESNPKVMVTSSGWVGIGAKFNSDEEEVDTKSLTKNMAKEVSDQILTILKSSLPNKLTNPSNLKFVNVGKGNLDSDEPSDYKVEVLWENDVENSDEVTKNYVDKEGKEINPLEAINFVDNLIIDESVYFEYIDANYPNYFKTISEKIKYFQPGFHSMTPEGLNTRLTFLNQCMRQGPSIYDKQTNKDGESVGIQPQNLSFGRPPICILRIGDFFHTKIAINSLSISYEAGSGIQYDLNPEGIGVQPMMANIQLSIDLIGGHTLSGPINRLQNAVSFNYYANTEMYDVRSDSVVDGFLQEGLKLSQLKQQLIGQETLSEIYDGLKTSDTLNQVEENEDSNDTFDDGVTDNTFLETFVTGNKTLVVKTVDGKKPSEIEFKEGNSGSTKENSEMVVNITTDIKETNEPGDVSKFEKDLSNEGLASVEKLKELTDAVNTAKADVTSAEQFFKANKNSQAARESYLESKEILKQKEEDYKDYLNNNETKFKVEAYLTKKKNKTRILKTFTVTKNGIT